MLKFLSAMFLIIGAVIGGGILGIPIVSAEFGFWTTLLILLLSWAIMTKSGLYILELCLQCPEHYNSYYSIVGKFIGAKVQRLTVALFLWLLYFSLSSYISGCSSFVMSHLEHWELGHHYLILCVLFTLVCGGLVVMGSKVIVRLNVFFVLSKLSLLLLIVCFSFHGYNVLPNGSFVSYHRGLLSLIVVIINAFGYQFIIPSLVSYYHDKDALFFKRVLIYSTTVVLILYVLWLYTVYSIIPLHGSHGLLAIYASDNQLLSLNTSFMLFSHSKSITHLISVFEIVALLSSFFCVALSVFDFLVDSLKNKNRVIVGFLTFAPPLLITLFSENMYVSALAMAGYIAIILEIIIPVVAYQGRHRSAVSPKTMNQLA